MDNQPYDTTHQPAGADSRPAVLDLPLILEQLQEQIDQLLDTVEAQQTIIEQHTARLAALEQRSRP